MIWILLAIALVLYIIYINLNTRNLPPAPFILPIVGNLYNFGFSPLEALAKIHEKHGPIVRMQLGNVQTIIISDLELIREAFLNKGKIYSDRPHVPIHDMLLGSNDIVTQDSGPRLNVMRKVGATMIRHTPEKKLVQVFGHYNGQLGAVLDEYAALGEPVDIKFYIDRMVMGGIMKLVYDFDIKLQREEDPKIGKILHLLESTVDQLGSFSLLSYYPNLEIFFRKHHEHISNFTKTRDKYLQEIVHSHIKNLDCNNPKDWIDWLLIETKDERENIFTPETISFIAWDLLLGGTDTTGTSLTWICFMLAKHPDIQEKARREVHSVLHGRLPTKSDVKAMPYINAVIKESMRLRITVPFYFPHRVAEDNNLGGYLIPKNSQIIGNGYAYHLSEKHFANARQFNPDRFLDTEQLAGEVAPFCVGYRQCLGLPIAEFNLFFSVCSLLNRFMLKPVPGQTMDPFNVDYHILLRPKKFLVLVERI